MLGEVVMGYDDPQLKEFENYYIAKKAGLRERAENWAVAIGLQRVDGLRPSKYLIEIAKKHIEGEISDVVFAIKYLRSMKVNATNDLFAENSWFFRNALVRANYEDPLKGIHRDFAPLERFFESLILGRKNNLQNRYLLVGLTEDERRQFAGDQEKRSEKGGQKKAVRKGGQKTVERLWQLLKDYPNLSQAGLVAALGITRSTVQKHINNLKRAGRLRRIGPDKGGHWEVVEGEVAR